MLTAPAARGGAKQAMQDGSGRKRRRSSGDSSIGPEGSVAASGAERGAKRAAASAQARQALLEPVRYIGCTHHARTNRWEAHIWDQGRQMYLGGWDTPDQAALAFDIAAIRLRGHDAQLNFHRSHYTAALAELQRLPTTEVVGALRKASRGGATQQSSAFRGVTKHQKGRWEARIGAPSGARYRYLGLHDTEVAAAIAYDTAAIEMRGVEAITNFHLSEYTHLLAPEQLADSIQRNIITAADLQLKEQMPQLLARAAAAEAAAAQQAAAAPSGGPASPPGSWAGLAAEGSAGLDSSQLAAAVDGGDAALQWEASPHADSLAVQLYDCLLQEAADSQQSLGQLHPSSPDGSSPTLQAPTTPACAAPAAGPAAGSLAFHGLAMPAGFVPLHALGA